MTEKCGYVAIIGRPNVGKSTLLNQLIGKKISITSPKPQTTRNQILGIKTVGDAQAVFIDTPGLHQAEKRAMNRYLNRLASSVIADADVIVFVIDARMWTEDDDTVLKKLDAIKAPVILVLNKVDKLKDKSRLLPFMEELALKYSFAKMVPMSAKNEKDVLALQAMIFDLLPASEHFFPDDQTTDKSLSFQVAEFIREKVISNTIEELPYSTTVTIDSMEDEEKILKISAIIWVERESQKPIVIGKDGERLKKIGTQARKDIEKLINKKVFLRLWVKVKSDWTDNESILQNFLTS
ncbi:MAG TPA: GTPase Era [Gammaproteobacteria bacterium]|jgi:GTP-binding protein Era|nr:GTPase Era [Gammaproteobacteria bacterium]